MAPVKQYESPFTGRDRPDTKLAFGSLAPPTKKNELIPLAPSRQGEISRSDHMAEQPEHSVTLEELRETIRSILTALRNHENPTEEIREVVAELGQIEEQFLDGLLPTAPLRVVLSIIAQFEYTPWRIPTVVEDLHKIWSLMGML